MSDTVDPGSAAQPPGPRRRRRRRATSAQGAPVPREVRSGTDGPASASQPARAAQPTRPEQSTTPSPTSKNAAIPEPRTGQRRDGDAKPSRRARPSRDAGERGLRDLVGAGSSQVGVEGALRARDVNRPTDEDLAEAEATLVVVRRHWTPPPS